MYYEKLRSAILKHAFFTEQEATAFCGAFKACNYLAKDYLLRAEELCSFEGFVVKGCLRVFSLDAKGGEHVLYFATEGWWVGDIDSFTTGRPSWLSIQALEDTVVLQVTKTDKQRLYAEIQSTEKLFRVLAQRAFVALQRRMLAALSQNADERYVAFVEKYPSLEQRLTQQQVAAYLGISHEFLSKIRKRLSQKK